MKKRVILQHHLNCTEKGLRKFKKEFKITVILP